MQVTGVGSLMNIHACEGAIRCPEEAAAGDDRVKELFFLDMLEAGFYMARRGFVALTLAVTDRDIDEFLCAAAGFVAGRRALLARG